jgi:hypothetical protein
VKIVQNGDERIVRVALPEANWMANTIKVRYQVFRIRKDQFMNETMEEHPMRYFFIPEMAFFLRQSGFDLLHACPSFEIERELESYHWNAALIAQAV